MVVRGPSPHLRPDPTAFLVREHLGLPQEPQRKNSRSLGGFFAWVHHARKRGEAVLGARRAVLVISDPGIP